MTGFDEVAMQRLEALTAQARSGMKLNAAEALELKELKLQKSAAALAQSRAQLAVARRKLEDREKYRLGGLAFAAQLNGWPEDALRGGFAMLAALAARGQQQAQAIPVKPVRQLRVAFAEAPGEAITTALATRPNFGPRRNSPAAWSSSSEPDSRAPRQSGSGKSRVLMFCP